MTSLKPWLSATMVAAVSAVACGTSDSSPVTPTGNSGGTGTASSGAGTNYVSPNTFDGSGNLAVAGGLYNGQNIGTPMELWMGVGNTSAGTLVGYVTFLQNPSRVRIDLSDFDGVPGPDMFPFVPKAIHIHFAPTVDGIPHTQTGNPAVGLFETNVAVTDRHQTIYEIPVEFDAVGAIHMSVHRYGGVEGFNFWLPDNQVTLRVVDYPSAGDPSYFRLKISGADFMSTYNMGYGPGVYEGWCIDVDRTIGLNVNYPAYLYSSYEPLPAWLVGPGKIERPENLDLVNYIANFYGTGQLVQPLEANCSLRVDSGTGQPVPMEALTYSDLQRAIWSFMDDNISTSGLSNWSSYRVNAIRCGALASGEGFKPTCDQKIVFLVVPTGNPGTFNVQVVIGQPVIGEIAVACTSAAGTAWGDGKYGAKFPGAKQWGTYFVRQP